MNKYGGLLKSIKEPKEPTKKAGKRRTSKSAAVRTTTKQPSREVATIATSAPRRGRPPAKHSDPNYTQVTAYVRKATHQEVKIALIRAEQEFSELVEHLLAQWLKSRG